MLIKQTTQMTDSEKIAAENSNNQFLQSLSFVAVGTIYPFAGSTIPDTFMLCDGSALDTTEYSELFSVIGYTYGGSGDSFNIPDLRGKVLVGCDSSDTSFNALGEKGGAKEVKLTVAQMPEHEGHLYQNVTDIEAGPPPIGNLAGYLEKSIMTAHSSSRRGWNSVAGNEVVPAGVSRGGDQPHENMPPYMVCNYIIKVNQGISTDDFRLPIDQTYTPTSPNAQSGLATAEAVGVANDYTDKAIKSSKTYANNTFAPAIKNTVSGSVLAVHDVSPVEHDLGVSVRSKNILPYPYVETTKTYNGITYTDNGDGTIIANGTATADSQFVLCNTSNQPYTDDFKLGNLTMSGCPEGGSADTYYMYSSYTGHKETGKGKYISPTAVGAFVHCMICINSGTTVENLVFKPQFEINTVATEYTPYVADLSEVGVSRLGKNITPYEHYVNKNSVYTTNGVTFTDNGDGSITANGTATKDIFYWLIPSGTFLLHSGTLTFSGCPSECLDMMSDIYLAVGQHPIYTKTENGAGITFKMESAIYAGMSINIASGVTCNNITFKPQLEYSSIATDYEPYIEPQTVTANADGTVEGLTSLSPNITVTTDTEGVVIDMTYNADTKMYIDNKLAEISTAIVNNV